MSLTQAQSNSAENQPRRVFKAVHIHLNCFFAFILVLFEFRLCFTRCLIRKILTLSFCINARDNRPSISLSCALHFYVNYILYNNIFGTGVS